MATKKKEPLVVQSNYLVGACVSLTLNEHKVLRYIISKIYRKGEELKKYRFLVSDLQEEMNMGGTCLYTDILRHLRTLRDTSFYVEDINSNERIYTSWLSSFKYALNDSSNDNKRYVEVVISEHLQPYLQNLDEYYTKYKLSDLKGMTSTYSLLLFEIFNKELYGKSNRDIIMPLYDFKELLGIPSDKYTRPYDLKKRVIDNALSEINTQTDLGVRYNFLKRNTTVTSIEFYISRN